MRKRLARHEVLRTAYHGLHANALSAVCRVSPELLARLRYRAAWGRWPDFENPTTFDEKLLWLNLRWRHPLKTECGDKFTVRGYVERLGLGHLLPRLHAVYESPESIELAALPDRFVLKCTHGCKCNVFCLDRMEFDLAVARRDLSRWIRTDYARLLGELHYAGMTPRIICEEFLDEGAGRLPTDYKVFCFNGRPLWILCYTDRSPNDKGRRVVVDANWNPTTVLRAETPGRTPPVGRLPELPELLRASEVLSAPFPFVRVDFYCINGRVVLGEMTFTPNACINRDYDQHAMGRRLELPQPWLASAQHAPGR